MIVRVKMLRVNGSITRESIMVRKVFIFGFSFNIKYDIFVNGIFYKIFIGSRLDISFLKNMMLFYNSY